MVLEDAGAAARHAAGEIAAAVGASAGPFTLASSGGGTAAALLDALAASAVPWPRVHLLQADERVAPDGDPRRNWRGLAERLLARVDLPPSNLHPMPVTAQDLAAAALDYAALLQRLAGRPPVLDLVHLGLGEDGHTASLVPGDDALHTVLDVAVTGEYAGLRRMTLTFPVLARARRLLWLVTGSGKAAMLARLVAGDHGIPAGRVARERALVVADRAAAADLPSS